MRVIKTFFILWFVSLSFAGFVWGQDLKEQRRRYYEKGRAYYEQGKYKQAQEEFQKALSLGPEEKEPPVYAPDKIKTQPARPGEYTIGEEDLLYISVWQDKELSQEAGIQPDGKISFPLAGEIYVLGLTTAQVKEELTLRLKDYIKNPIVSVSLKRIGGRKIILLGQVPKQGVYQLTNKKTLLELIALSGGFSADAVLSSVIVIRGGFQNPKGMRLNLARTIDKADVSQNIILEAEDIVYVPKKFIANVSYFVSQVIGPIASGRLNVDDIMTGR